MNVLPPVVERVAFDVQNVQHREAYAYFLEHSKWGANSPRFILEDAAPSIPLMISKKLMQFYIEQDKKNFGPVA